MPGDRGHEVEVGGEARPLGQRAAEVGVVATEGPDDRVGHGVCSCLIGAETLPDLDLAFVGKRRAVDDLAWSCDRLAFFAVEHRDFAAAEAMLGQRRALLDQLAWLRPHSLTNLAGERELHSLWSHLEGSRGNHVARQQHLRAAVPLAREWLRRSPNDHQAIITFTNTVYSYVAYEPTPVSDAEARPLVLEALASVERMLVQEPRHALGNDLARYLRGKAQALGR